MGYPTASATGRLSKFSESHQKVPIPSACPSSTSTRMTGSSCRTSAKCLEAGPRAAPRSPAPLKSLLRGGLGKDSARLATTAGGSRPEGRARRGENCEQNPGMESTRGETIRCLQATEHLDLKPYCQVWPPGGREIWAEFRTISSFKNCQRTLRLNISLAPIRRLHFIITMGIKGLI
jgi:hypothetical protein